MTTSKATTAAPRLVTISEAANYIGRNVRFMRRLVAARELPYYKPGRALRFDVRDLDAYLASCRVERRVP